MRKLLGIIVIALSGIVWAQTLSQDQQGEALTHITEIAEQMSLQSVLCPLSGAAPIEAPMLSCLLAPDAEPNVIRLGWDMLSAYGVTAAAEPVTTWTLDTSTGVAARTYALPEGAHYTVAFMPSDDFDGRIWIGVHAPR